MTAATTDRRLLIAVAAVGVVAGLVGIGASIAGTEDDREPEPTAATTTSAPPAEAREEEQEAPAEEDEEAAEEAAEDQLEAEAAASREQAEQIAQGEVPGPVDRARISAEGWEVRIDTEHGHTDVLVDATTGAVLEVDD